MTAYTDKLRETARRLLSEGTVEGFLGFGKGSVAGVNPLVMARRPEDVDQLVWDAQCGMNLANFVRGHKGKIGLPVVGCWSRNIVTLIQEHQVAREKLYLVGIPCEGMADRDNPDKPQDNCATCTHHNPVIHDEMLGQPVAEKAGVAEYADVAAIEALSDDARWQRFTESFSACIRCYACRNACPMCYCPTCFVDESKPQWVGKSIDPTDTMTFHFLRAFHLAGRCTDCGACERACPVNIPVRYLTKKLNKDARELFGFESGLDPEVRPLLDQYRIDDVNDFIK